MNFNSIKVRLELSDTPATSNHTLDFNSIKVRLEPSVCFFFCVVINYFNSIKVRLEQIWRTLPNSLYTFQFHKGTIRTSNINIRFLNLLNFNSIKVRLEPTSWCSTTSVIGVFQFHKGTIRTVLGGYADFGGLAFQFHKGTIRTHPLPWTALCWTAISIP